MNHKDPQQDVRWKQRFQNLERAAANLDEAVRRTAVSDDKLLRSGLIQNFEFTFELSWKTLKDYISEQGIEVNSPKETLRQAYQLNLVDDGEGWLKALAARNITTHVYEEEEIADIAYAISETYFPLVQKLVEFLRQRL